MYELKTNTATRIAVGPLVDPTDGKTAETALTVTDLSVQIYQIKNDGTAVVRSQFAPTASGGNNDMALVSSSTDGMYDLELTAAQLNFLGNARITFYDVDGFLVHWIDILVVSAAYFDWKYGATIPNVNATQISGDSDAADNLEAAYDGTGYAGGTIKPKVDLDTIKTQAVTCAAGVTVRANVGTASESTAQTGDSFARLGAPAGASVSADIAAVKAETALIVADTNELQTDLANGGRLDLLIDAILEDTGTTLPGTLSTIAGYLDTEIAAILEDTGTTIPATLATLAGYIDTEVASILAAVDTEVAAILADTNELQTDWANGGRLDLILDAAGSAGDPWSTPLPGAYGAGTAGKIVGDNINATISSRSSHSAADVWAVATRTLTSFGTLVSDIWASATRTLTAISDSSGITTLLSRIGAALTITGGKVDVNDKTGFSGTVTDKTGFSLATAPPTAEEIKTAMEADGGKLDHLWEMTEDDGGTRRLTANALEQAPTGGGSAPTAAEVADAVWDEVLDTAHEVAGSASVLLQASGAAGDPMSVAVPGSYPEGTAGYVIGHLESSGSGSVYWPYTVTDSANGNPIEGVTVSVSTDIAGTVVIASGTTNASGVVNFNLDPGTYYLWLSKTGYTFSNPDQEEVA